MMERSSAPTQFPNPPKIAAANLKESITMAKSKAKERNAKRATGPDKKTALLLSKPYLPASPRSLMSAVHCLSSSRYMRSVAAPSSGSGSKPLCRNFC